MSDLPDPLPDPSQTRSRPESLAEPGPRPVPSHELPDVDTPAAQMAPAVAEGLNASQRAVMGYLAAGNSIAKAARLGHVSRRTVHRWFKEDANFCAVYNAWQRELAASARNRALAMCDDALDTIHNAILTGNVNASLTLTKSLGVLGKRRIGPDDPQRISHQRRVRQMRRVVAERRAVEDARYGLPATHPLFYTPEERARIEEQDRLREEDHRKQQENEPEWRQRFRQASKPQDPAGPPAHSPPPSPSAPDSPPPANPQA